MRFPVALCTLVALTTLGMVGCKSDSSTAYAPSWSFSKLNPFKGSGGDAPRYPPRPSTLATPTQTGDADAGYAAASSDAGSQGTMPATYYGYSNAPSSGAGAATSPGYGSPGTSTASTNPLTAPQQGYYNAGGSYGTAGSAENATQASPNAGTNPYSSISADRYASRSFAPGGTGGLYGGSGQAASPYEAASDRYGTSVGSTGSTPSSYGTAGGSSSPYNASPYRSGPSAASRFKRDPYAPTGPAGGSRYATPDASGYGASSVSPYAGSGGSPYGAGASNGLTPPADTATDNRYGSLSGDRYASAAGATEGNSPYSPGHTGYSPGQTGYNPPESSYKPGATGYQPPGTSPYQLPATGGPTSSNPYAAPSPYTAPNPYTAPAPSSSGGIDADPHFRPGSTSDYGAAATGTSSAAIPSISYPSSGATPAASSPANPYSMPSGSGTR